MALTRDLCWWNRVAFWCTEEVFRRISWLPGGGGLTAPYTRSNRPLWTAGFRVVFAVVGACVLRLLVVFVPRTSSTPVATWFWQTEGRSAECVILGVRPSEFILSEFQSPLRRIFISSHSLPPLWSPNRSFNVDPAPPTITRTTTSLATVVSPAWTPNALSLLGHQNLLYIHVNVD
jgi:hypothetical protein